MFHFRIRSFIVNDYNSSKYIDYYYSKMIAPHIIQWKHSFLKNLEKLKIQKMWNLWSTLIKMMLVHLFYIFMYETTNWCTTFIKSRSDTAQRAGAAANRCLFNLVTFELFISRTRKHRVFWNLRIVLSNSIIYFEKKNMIYFEKMALNFQL